MVGLFRAARSTRPVVRAYGKLPWAHDFIRVGPLDAAPTRLVEWLERGMESAKRVVGPEWEVLFDTGGPQGFLFRGPRDVRNSDLLVGVLVPSRDAVGRRFPFAVYTSVSVAEAAAAPHCLPHAVGDFVHHAWSVAARGESLGSVSALESMVGTIPVGEWGLDRVAREYDAWVQATPVGTVAARVVGAPSPDLLLGSIYLVGDAVRPVRGDEQAATRLALRLPVGQPRATACVFWLDVLRRSARWRKASPTAFWGLSDEMGALVVQLGETPDATLAELWAPRPNADHVYDLALPRLPSRLPESLRAHAWQEASAPMMLQSLGAMD